MNLRLLRLAGLRFQRAVAECELCRPGDVVFENESAYARPDNNALSRGHLLVVPKRHVADFFAMTAEEQGAVLRLLNQAHRFLEEKHSPDGYNIGVNIGKAGGQSRMHVHLHLIPRYAGDVPDPRGGIRCVLRSQLLHITNGDCAVAVLSQAVSGSILPWRDVLHEGPVRAGLSLEALSAERALFIAEAGWGDLKEVTRSFAERDAAFRRAGEHDEIVLWFEHDLYDQLQLVQVLDGLSALRGPPISIVCEPEYLGPMAPARAAELFELRNPVTRRHLQEASAAWAAFRSPDPQALHKLKTTSLPFLAAALRRHLEEFPWTSDGLSRTERQILDALRGGPLPFQQLFLTVQEDPAFLGDAVLAWHLQRLRDEGLIDGKRQRRLPRWLGGYEVKDEALRWDPGLGRLVS